MSRVDVLTLLQLSFLQRHLGQNVVTGLSERCPERNRWDCIILQREPT
jgi:hypothetical protein